GGTTGDSQVGVYVRFGGSVGDPAGSGLITINGTGGSGNGDGFNAGIAIDAFSSLIQSGDGDIQLTGVAGTSATNNFGNNDGVSVNGNIIVAGAGKLTI